MNPIFTRSAAAAGVAESTAASTRMIKAFGTMGFLPAGLDSWRIIIRSVDAAQVKQLAKDLGADLVGVASAATLNAHPPDPKWPQTPERISPYVKSVIVVAQRIPAGDDDDEIGRAHV